MKNTIKTITATALLFVAFTSQANAADAWGAVAPVAKKKPVGTGGWGAIAPVKALANDETAYKAATHDIFDKATHKAVDKAAVVLAPGEAAYNHTTHDVFDKATHDAVLLTDLAQLKLSHANLSPTNFSLNGALAFAEFIKNNHNIISTYLSTAGKNLLGSLAAGEGAPWAEDTTEALLTTLNIAGIPEFLSDTTTAISTLSEHDALVMLESADSPDKAALIAGLHAEAGRINAAASDTSGTDTLEALKTNLQIRAFLKMVA